MWVFNPVKVELQFSQDITQVEQSIIDLGLGDLEIDAGSRSNDASIVDQGERV
jgi:hypothetical protein